MKKFILQFIILGLSVYFLLPAVVSGIFVNDYEAAIIAALLFAFINVAVKPILKIVTLPFNILTFGLFGFFVNILLFWFVTSIITGIQVADFTAALFGALVLTVVNWLIGMLLD